MLQEKGVSTISAHSPSVIHWHPGYVFPSILFSSPQALALTPYHLLITFWGLVSLLPAHLPPSFPLSRQRDKKVRHSPPQLKSSRTQTIWEGACEALQS